MNLKTISTIIKKNWDLSLAFFWGFLAVITSIFTSSLTEPLSYIRWVLAIPFILISGYPAVCIFFRKLSSIGLWDRLLLTIPFSFLLTYPAGLLNLLLEGKRNIFQPHLTGFLFFLLLITSALALIAVRLRKGKAFSVKKPNLRKKFKEKPNQILILILLVSFLLSFMDLGRADIYSDEYSISFRAYDLVDGNTPARAAYLISLKSHGPLTTFIIHGFMQALNPNGYYQISDWVIRAGPAFVGISFILLTFVLTRRLFDEKAALLAALLMTVNNHVIWLSRILHREIFVLFFAGISLYTFVLFYRSEGRRELYLAGIFLGAALLVKFTAAILAGVYLLFILLRKRSKLLPLIKVFIIAGLVFSPVLAFNLGSYITTGYVDLAFGKLLSLNNYMGDLSSYPGAPFAPGNLASLFANLFDIYSIPIFTLFIISSLTSLVYLSKERGDEIILLWLFLLAFILYFWRLGVRSYYAPYVTIPFVLFTAWALQRFWAKRPSKELRYAVNISLLALILFSAAYSYNTNLSDDYFYDAPEELGEPGRSGSTVLPLTFSSFSRAARVTVETYGLKRLESYLLSELSGSELVLLDEAIDLLAKERYLSGKDWTLDFLGEEPKTELEAKGVDFISLTGNVSEGDYAILAAESLPLREWKIPNGRDKSYEKAKEGSLKKTITAKDGRALFYVYRLND